jgi:hypothetical protein
MFHVLGDILLVTSADESRRQIVVCPPVYAAAGLAISPCGVTSADESRRQIVVCLPVYAAGLAISPCGAELQSDTLILFRCTGTFTHGRRQEARDKTGTH